MPSRIWRAPLLVVSLAGAACPADLSRPPVDTPTDETPPVVQRPEDDADAIDELVREAGALEVDPAVPPTELDCEAPLCPADGQEGDFYCSYRRVAETQRRDDLIALQPNSANLWPGSMLRGLDASQGLLTPLGLPLAPVTFSVSLENLAGSPVGEMQSPSLSAFRQERNRILSADVTGATAAALDFEIAEVHSESQLAVALHAGASWPGIADLAASFDFDSEEQHTRVLVDFTQAYYTIDVDTPDRPADFFDPAVTADEVADRIGDGDPPVYVQSITYGRRALFTVETSESATRVEAALEAALSGTLGALADAEVDVSFEDRSVLEESTIRAFVYGGSGAEAATLIDGVEGLLAYVRDGGDYSRDSPGAPIAYKLAYLDNSVTELSFASEYTERVCTRNRTDMVATLTELRPMDGGDVGGNLELYGHATIRVPTADSPVTSCTEGGRVVDVWRLDEGQWVVVPEDGAWTPQSPSVVTIEDVPIGPDAHVCLEVELWDEDEATNELSSDDSFGLDQLLVSVEPGTDWPGEHVLHPRGLGENAADVRIVLGVSE